MYNVAQEICSIAGQPFTIEKGLVDFALQFCEHYATVFWRVDDNDVYQRSTTSCYAHMLTTLHVYIMCCMARAE